MRTVWKFPFMLLGQIGLQMPQGAKILLVQPQIGQGNWPTMWAEIDTDAPLVERYFLLTGTGHPIPENAGEHIASFQHGAFVWHLWEKR